MTRLRRRQAAAFRPSVEFLERRCVPATITPTTFADDGLGSGSLRDAVLQFNADTGTDDDTIQLLAGTYALTIQNTDGHHETAGLEGDLNITNTSHRLIVQGAGSSGDDATIIDAGQLQDRVFQIVNPGTQVVFQNLVITGGLAQDDGSEGALPGTTDSLGGGILNNGGDVTLDNVVLENNVAQGGDVTVLSKPGHNASGAGIYSTGGALTLAGATIANNRAIGGRGGDHNGFNHAGNGGAATGAGLYATGGSLDISESMIASNHATGGRGGDGFSSCGSWCSSTGGGGAGGSAPGGGLYVSGSSLTVATSTIASNQGTGGLRGFGGSSGVGQGGGLYNGGTLTLSNSTLSGNSASFEGGAIANSGMLTLSNSTLSGNSAGGTPYNYGGGIMNLGTLTVSNSTLSGNSASYEGGGISNFGTLTVSNSTLSGNSAYYDGGGIYDFYGTLTLTNATLTANRANIGNGGKHGGGLFVHSVSLVPLLHNTLIAGNFRGATGTTRDDVYGALNSGGDYNLIGDGTGMTGLSNGVNGNQVGSASHPIDPMLGALQDNGGPTLTHALQPGSPALNAGDPNQLGTTDQRGVVRTGGVNIGAYQASASAFLLDAPATVTAGVPFDVTVTAVDPFGQVAVGYSGTVTFSTTDPDPGVVLPADYTFTADDGGLHTFTDTGLGETTLITPGDQMLTVTDTADNTITGSAIVTVNSPAPPPGGGAIRPSTPTPSTDRTRARSESSHPEVVSVDRLFASLNKWDAGNAFSRPMRHQRAGADSWALDPWWGEEPLLI